MQVRWETDTKYYEVRLVQDLFDDWVLMVARGRKQSRLGALRTIYVFSEERGMKKIEMLEKVRTRHGYVRVPCVSAFPPDGPPDQR
jgi:hypothetical protein